MNKKKPKLEYYLVCEDIRHEINNRISLIGVLPDKLRVRIPSTLPKIGFHIVLSGAEPGASLNIEVLGPDGSLITTSSNKLPPKDDDSSDKVVIDGVLTAVAVPVEGSIRVIISVGEESPVKHEAKLDIVALSSQEESNPAS